MHCKRLYSHHAPFWDRRYFTTGCHLVYTPTTLPSNQVSIVVTTPGTWTVVVVDQTNQCQTVYHFQLYSGYTGATNWFSFGFNQNIKLLHAKRKSYCILPRDTVNTSYNWVSPFGAGNLASNGERNCYFNSGSYHHICGKLHYYFKQTINNTCISAVSGSGISEHWPTISISAGTGTFTCK